jgi:hypothetical protein
LKFAFAFDFDVTLSEGGIPRAVSSAGDPSRRAPWSLTTVRHSSDLVVALDSRATVLFITELRA